MFYPSTPQARKDELLHLDPLHSRERSNELYGVMKLDLSSGQHIPRDAMEAVSMGTTILAVTYAGGVVLAADSRTSSGSYVHNKVSNKCTQLADRIYCGRSGSAADTQAVAQSVAHYLMQQETIEGCPPTVQTAAKITQRICYEHRSRILAGMLICGWDSVNGGQVFSIPPGGALLQQDFAMSGSGSTYLYGWADKHHRKGMTREEALRFVREGVAHAIARDGFSGGVIRTVCIDENGVTPETLEWSSLPYALERDERFTHLVSPCAAKE
ncbi:proteasome beta-1 subunit [Perkinsela sp. CCAP 1560/4]|nr:proteasome beta-1 subunit [Perkinsela sp. CCAP 1560/4]|eukprot:KNH07936.1 proteasome beta-1 subunit [Perkinsela sp. CCAP 1560/4]